MLRLKMVAQSVAQEAGASERVVLLASTTTDGDNKDWSKWTPSGNLTFQITNPDAQGKIQPGAVYFVTIEPVPEITAKAEG